ncbi:general odorant-binding protein 56h [Drosophila subpulchrella]|uniref:general odorant-binding protein 56h n=1 Tax=Drosophila subpulchrella TaxID=1486046 RepID=UPI0018A17D47|nr:general odorant-binding protein 56h [Drosophila subpulchrella]
MRATLVLTLLLSCLTGILSQKKLDATVSKALVEGCMKENGVTNQDIEDLQSGKVKAEDAKDNIKCSTQCILVKSGFMDSTGKLLTDKVKAHYDNTKFRDAVEKDLERCSKVKGENACDTAFQILACFQGVN